MIPMTTQFDMAVAFDKPPPTAKSKGEQPPTPKSKDLLVKWMRKVTWQIKKYYLTTSVIPMITKLDKVVTSGKEFRGELHVAFRSQCVIMTLYGEGRVRRRWMVGTSIITFWNSERLSNFKFQNLWVAIDFSYICLYKIS